MSKGATLRAWLLANRTSARIALGLRLFTMSAGVVLSLLWAKFFILILGPAVYGVYLSFQSVIRVAGMGDFGITGALGLRTGQMLGRGEESRLRAFLASARTLFLCLALAISLGFALLSPWLPHWLGFVEVQGAGSLQVLFCTGSLLVFASFVVGYFNSLNSGCGTVMWPILPALVIGQLSLAGQWFLAHQGAPIWTLMLTQAGFLIVQAGFAWAMLRASFAPLSRLRPLTYDPVLWRDLVSTSGWVCLYVLGNVIYTTTDTLLINAGFGSATVPAYNFNYKPIDMAVQIVLSASAVSVAKFNLWIANPAPESQDRARAAIHRLGLFQSLAGLGGALAYLALDNKFIELWQGRSFQMPMALQWAFALNLVVTTAGDAGIQTSGLLGRHGLRNAGLTIGLTGVLNFILSFAAMRYGWLTGIACATVIAQTILSLVLGLYVCRHMKISVGKWLTSSWLVPVAAVALMAFAQYRIGSENWGGALSLLGVAAVIWLVAAPLAGMNRDFIRHEWTIIRGLFGK